MEDYFKQNSECSICFHLFTDPQILECQHTFCRTCVDGIKRGNDVTCAICRRTCAFDVIKADFKTKELVDTLKRLAKDDESNNDVCDVTNNHNKPHSDALLQSQRKTVEIMICEVEKAMRDVTQAQADTAQNVTQARERSAEIRTALIERCDEVDNAINDVSNTKTRSLQKSFAELQERLTLLQDELDILKANRLSNKDAPDERPSLVADSMSRVAQIANLTTLDFEPAAVEVSGLTTDEIHNTIKIVTNAKVSE